QHDARALEVAVITVDDVDLGAERRAVAHVGRHRLGGLAAAIDQNDLAGAAAVDGGHSAGAAHIAGPNNSDFHGRLHCGINPPVCHRLPFMARRRTAYSLATRVASNRNQVRRSASSIEFSIKLALATSSCLSQMAWASRKLAVSCLLSSRSSASMSRGVTKSASLSNTRCKRPMWPIERSVVPPILRTRSAMASVAAKICSPCSSRRR